MFFVNTKLAKKLESKEIGIVNREYLLLAFLWENTGELGGSRNMRLSPESRVIAAETIPYHKRKAFQSFEELFILNKMVKERTGEYLIGSVKERTPEDAMKAWRMLYRAINF